MKFLKSRSSTAVGEPAAGPHGNGAAADLLPPEDMTEMSFLDHLEELRWRILKALGSILVMAVVALVFADFVIDDVLLGPTYADFFMYKVLPGFRDYALDIDLQNRTVTGQFFAYWGAVIVVGLIAASPVVVYQMWKFIEPGLYPNEKKGMRFSAVFATFFLILGISFGYLILTPLALQFFAHFSISDRIVNEFDITKYFSMVTMWTFGVGVLFELPVVIYFLAKLGIVTPEVLRMGRKYALIGVLVMAAFLTPPDPISQILVAIPLLMLYEGSIYLAGWVVRKEERALREALE